MLGSTPFVGGPGEVDAVELDLCIDDGRDGLTGVGRTYVGGSRELQGRERGEVGIVTISKVLDAVVTPVPQSKRDIDDVGTSWLSRVRRKHADLDRGASDSGSAP